MKISLDWPELFPGQKSSKLSILILERNERWSRTKKNYNTDINELSHCLFSRNGSTIVLQFFWSPYWIYNQIQNSTAQKSDLFLHSYTNEFHKNFCTTVCVGKISSDHRSMSLYLDHSSCRQTIMHDECGPIDQWFWHKIICFFAVKSKKAKKKIIIIICSFICGESMERQSA